MSDHTSAIHWGTPSPQFKGWETTKVYFHGFENSRFEDSSEFTCLGDQWRLHMEFEGDYIALDLSHLSNKSITISYGVSIKNSEDNVVAHKYMPQNNLPRQVRIRHQHTFNASDLGTIDIWDFDDHSFNRRSKLFTSLVDGALVFEVHMKPFDSTSSPTYIPKNPAACEFIRSLFMDEKTSDVVIEIGGQEVKGDARKIAKATSVFHAHRLILQKSSTALAELCGSGEERATVIQINDASPEVFRHLLCYMYGGEINKDNMKSLAKEIIDAANRYGVVNLKLEAEALYVGETTITFENMMDHLHYADSMNCALLKEAVIDFIVENKLEVLKKVPLKDAPGGLLADVLVAVARGENNVGNATRDGDQYTTMRVCELRQKAHEKGICVDGTREILIKALTGS
jgi:hypothetical protein